MIQQSKSEDFLSQEIPTNFSRQYFSLKQVSEEYSVTFAFISFEFTYQARVLF